MKSPNENIDTAPVLSDGTGDVGGGSSSPVLLDAKQGRCDVVAPLKMTRINFIGRNSKELEMLMKKHKIPEDIDDETLTVWRLEQAAELREEIEEIARIVSELHNFASATKNVHKQIKEWAKLLKQKSDNAKVSSEYCEVITEKQSIRVKDLSDSLFEVSGSQPVPPFTSEKSVQTETEQYAPRGNNKNSTTTTTRFPVLHTPTNDGAATISYGRRKKAKMKKTGITEPTWAEVAAARTAKPGSSRQHPEPAADKNGRQNKSRSSAVIIEKSSFTYGEVLRRVKEGLGDMKTVKILRIRETRQGNLIMEVDGGAEAAERLREAVVGVLDPSISVRRAVARKVLEVKDLDCLSSSEDVVGAVNREMKLDDHAVKVLHMRRSYGGCKTAMISLPRETAEELLKVGRLRVGIVYGRVAEHSTKLRCFRCFAFGHRSQECVGEDRKDHCRRCGISGHYVAKCEAKYEAARAFARKLNMER